MKNSVRFLTMSLLCAFVAGIYAASPDDPNFELWNKTHRPIWYKLENGGREVTKRAILGPNAKNAYKIDINKKSILDIDDNLNNRPLFAAWTRQFEFTPGKTIYVRLKQENNEDVFGPQTGPWLGWKGRTDSGYSLSNNVKKTDINESYSKASESILLLPTIARAIAAKKITRSQIIASPNKVSSYLILGIDENATNSEIDVASEKLQQEINAMGDETLDWKFKRNAMKAIVFDANGKAKKQAKR